MNRFVIRTPALALACASVLVAGSGSARVSAQQNNDDWCSQDRWGRDRAGVCQVREFTVAATAGTLEVSGTNGGITVEGESRGDVRILAKIVATAETEQRAKAIADAVQLKPTLELVQADGPRNLQNREGWSVSYRISVPRALNLSLKTSNGGITVREVESQVTFRTSNGGVKLIGVSGDVQRPDQQRRRGHRSRRHRVDRRGPGHRNQQRRREARPAGELLRPSRSTNRERRRQLRLPRRRPEPLRPRRQRAARVGRRADQDQDVEWRGEGDAEVGVVSVVRSPWSGSSAAGSSPVARVAELPRATGPRATDYVTEYFSIHPNTASCHARLLLAPSTQCPSSGNTSASAATPLRRRTVNICRP